MNFPYRKEIAFYYHLFKFPLQYKEYSLSKRISILFDYYKLYRKKRLQMNEYYEYEFEKCSKEFRNSFLGWIEQGYYLRILNPVKYYTLARNKYLTHLCLEKVGIPMPELLGYYNPYQTNADDEFANQLLSLQEKKKIPFVIKATESSHGEGVYVVESIVQGSNKIWLNLINKKRIDLTEILKHKDELIVETLIKQTEQLSSFNKTSVNTIRFMTTLYPNGDAKIIATFIKIGRNGAYVDNAGAGGNVDANINIETGEINKVITFKAFRKSQKTEFHPDTGIKLEGIIIDHWEEIKEKVISYQKHFPFVKAAGWDIAITDEGPIVIEVNDSWDRTGQLFIQKGWKHEIKDCYEAWNKIGYNTYVDRFINNQSHKKMNTYKRLFK